jgi:hypothetical protein
LLALVICFIYLPVGFLPLAAGQKKRKKEKSTSSKTPECHLRFWMLQWHSREGYI